MGAPRFFSADDVTAGALVALEEVDAHHASGVLRAKAGEPLTLVSAGAAWDAEFATIGKNSVTTRVVRRSADQGGELPVQVVVLQALTKGAKFDDVVEKTVELGASRIVPVLCARSEAEGGPNKTDRWRRIARAAAMQSRRRIVPEIEPSCSWDDALDRFAAGALTLVAFERADKGSFATAIATYRDNAIVIAVGPEGGLQADEVARARRHGAQIVSLGPTTLRTETAAAALLAASASSLGWW